MQTGRSGSTSSTVQDGLGVVTHAVVVDQPVSKARTTVVKPRHLGEVRSWIIGDGNSTNSTPTHVNIKEVVAHGSA